jgi:mRNA-degrading endonuclease RelE of RelBE toxin-antitoxin system
MYAIELTETARLDLQWFKKHEQNIIVDGIARRLRHEPTQKDRNRKQLCTNATADWALRVGQFRVLYNVDVQIRIVSIQRNGEKRGNAFFFRGQKEDV